MHTRQAPDQRIVGVDLGGTKIFSILADPAGTVLSQDLRDTQASQGPQEVIRHILESIRQVSDGTEIAGIGIGAAGACEAISGTITSSPNLPGWSYVPLKEIVERELGTPTYVDNDANVAALGEHRFGAAKGVDHFILLTVGTGIGGGIVINGELYRGASGAAGEVGHMTIDDNGQRCNCGNIGCWETLASGSALAREAVRLIEAGAETTILDFTAGNRDRVSAQTVYLAAQGGDRLAHELIARTGYYLGVGLVNLINIFNPQLILIGGGLCRMGQLIMEPAIRVVRERAFDLPARAVRIELGGLGIDAGAFGAIALVLKESARASYSER
ncbi:MAG: ROK family protein [Chloroflexota bacterium]|nr:ROK family protein [Chloroflexota bacterium]